MGAAAITTLAGATLVARADHWPVLARFTPMLEGMTIFFWSAATWWIPFLAALTSWRYLVRRDTARYEPQLWSMVFPLGMYTTATLQMGRALELPMIIPLSEGFVYVALAAWIATFVAMVLHLLRIIILEPERM